MSDGTKPREASRRDGGLAAEPATSDIEGRLQRAIASTGALDGATVLHGITGIRRHVHALLEAEVRRASRGRRARVS